MKKTHFAFVSFAFLPTANAKNIKTKMCAFGFRVSFVALRRAMKSLGLAHEDVVSFPILRRVFSNTATDSLRIFYGASTGFLRVQSVEMRRKCRENAYGMRSRYEWGTVTA